MAAIKLGNFRFGIDNRSDETSIREKSARAAYNIKINDAGGFYVRDGFVLRMAIGGAHSLWAPKSGAYALYAQQSTLYKLMADGQGSGAVPVALLAGLSGANKVSFCDFAGTVFFTNGLDLGRVDAGSARLIGVPTPQDAPVISSGAGGLLAGNYACAYSFVDQFGEESGLSLSTPVSLSGTGGITFSLPVPPAGASQIRLYTTPVNGDVFYQMAQIPAGLLSFTIGDNTPGKQASTHLLKRMPGGSIVRGFNGRLLVARERVLHFSEPFQYGLTSPRHGFIAFATDIIMVEPVKSGVFVGTTNQVFFLSGPGPHDFTQSVVSSNVPVAGSSSEIGAELLPKEIADMSSSPAVVWLGRMGYSVGLSDGTVHNIQAERILLPGYGGGTTVSYIKNGISQVFSVVHSPQSNLDLTSLDSIN